MIDDESVVLLGKLKMLAKKVGSNVDIIQMSSDKSYAENMLRELSNADEPELVMVSINLMNRMGMMGTAAVTSSKDEKSTQQYIGRLR